MLLPCPGNLYNGTGHGGEVYLFFKTNRKAFQGDSSRTSFNTEVN